MPKQPSTIASGRFLRFVQRDGWEFVTRSNASGVVAIIALTDDDELVLVEQHRPPLGRTVIEIPAGLVGDDAEKTGEADLEAARREFLEETGYTAEGWRSLITCASSAGLTDECIHFFRADGLTKAAEGGGVDGEGIRVVLVPRSRIHAWIQERVRDGLAVDAKVYSAIALLDA
ncbi:MAG: NUDIX hydrolase [Planctomycetota bacterium]|jgi:ADP-ribose pyrophosphatase|nr:NUDIX hydrolase [Planctomycetota bacterium]